MSDFETFLSDEVPKEAAQVLRYVKAVRDSQGSAPNEKKMVARMQQGRITARDEPSYFEKFTADEAALAFKVEAMRAAMRASEDRPIVSFGAGQFETTGSGKVLPGARNEETISYQSGIGSKPNKGVLLKRIVEAFGVKRVLELGTNTGLGSCYISQARGLDALVTIEGSPDLAKLADEHLAQVSTRHRVITGFFSDVIADLRDQGEAPFDLVFIDGQHERRATIAYTDLVEPLMASDSVFIYDDIFWSAGMNEAWRDLVRSGRFAYTFEADSIGLAIRGGQALGHIDVSAYLPSRKISAKRQ